MRLSLVGLLRANPISRKVIVYGADFLWKSHHPPSRTKYASLGDDALVASRASATRELVLGESVASTPGEIVIAVPFAGAKRKSNPSKGMIVYGVIFRHMA